MRYSRGRRSTLETYSIRWPFHLRVRANTFSRTSRLTPSTPSSCLINSPLRENQRFDTTPHLQMNNTNDIGSACHCKIYLSMAHGSTASSLLVHDKPANFHAAHLRSRHPVVCTTVARLGYIMSWNRRYFWYPMVFHVLKVLGCPVFAASLIMQGSWRRTPSRVADQTSRTALQTPPTLNG